MDDGLQTDLPEVPILPEVPTYPCPECYGEGEVECGECGCEHECERCGGTGLDPALVDIERFRLAEKEHGLPSWALEEKGQFVGRAGDGWKLYYKDFLLQPDTK